MIYACLLMCIKSSFTTSSISLPPCLRHPPYQGWIFASGGQRPPFSLAPSHRCRGALPRESLLAYRFSHLSRVHFINQPHMYLVPNPALVPFLFIFDMYLLDIPPPHSRSPPGISLPLSSLSTCKIVQPLRRLRRLPELRGGFFGGLAFADKVICPKYLFVN